MTRTYQIASLGKHYVILDGDGDVLVDATYDDTDEAAEVASAIGQDIGEPFTIYYPDGEQVDWEGKG